MNLTHPSEVRDLLAQLGLRPRRALGQNFLIDANILRILLSAAELHQEDRVLEIGPGLGVVTEWLLRWAGRVVAIEKDPVLYAHLRGRFEGAAHLDLRCGDALDADLEALFADGVNKVVANLPYSIGSRFLVRVLQVRRPPERVVVTVQREVADRLAAAPATKDYGLLGILTQQRYAVRVRKEVSPTCFLPTPEVRSAIVELRRREEDDPPAEALVRRLDLLHRAFSRRRKKLLPLLQQALPAESARALCARLGVALEARPENVTPAQWAALAESWPGS